MFKSLYIRYIFWDKYLRQNMIFYGGLSFTYNILSVFLEMG